MQNKALARRAVPLSTVTRSSLACLVPTPTPIWLLLHAFRRQSEKHIQVLRWHATCIMLCSFANFHGASVGNSGICGHHKRWAAADTHILVHMKFRARVGQHSAAAIHTEPSTGPSIKTWHCLPPEHVLTQQVAGLSASPSTL